MALRDALDRSQPGDPLWSFLICDLDSGTPSYYGYQTTAGGWVIKRLDEGAGTMRYAFGSGDYQTAWTNRASLTYTHPDLT